jgi:phosphatidylglycerol:prolipoprotein diacylglycerol transferase
MVDKMNTINPVAITISGFEIKWYSLFILAAVVLGIFTINREAKRFNIREDFVFNMMFWAFIFGLVGARLYFVLFNLDLYTDFVDVFKVWEGGLAIHGGLIAGLLVILYYCKKYKVRTIRMLDIITPSLLLCQAIGRWGNFFNQEAHGAATTLETLKRLGIPDFIINGMNIEGAYYMPTFLFESILCLIAFIVVIIVRRGKYVKVGQPTALYLMSYGAIRFFIEISRTDSLMLGAFKMAQVVSVIFFIVGVGILAYTSRKSKFEDLYNDKSNTDEIRF